MDRERATSLLSGLVGIGSLSGEEREASTWLVEQARRAGYDRAFVDGAGNAVAELGDERAAVVWLEDQNKVKKGLPVRDYKLSPRFGDLTFLRTAASVTLDALGLSTIARQVEQGGMDRLGLDGMLAIWEPGAAN